MSGLLFKQYSYTGEIRWTRFVVRRGFKIYPAFYYLLAFYTVGLTDFYLGSGAILVAVVSKGLPKCWLTSRIALIGTFSYSIYLRHAAICSWMFPATTSPSGEGGARCRAQPL